MEQFMTKAELVDMIHAKAGLPTKTKTEEIIEKILAELSVGLFEKE